uniref:Nudix hydrolase domain-containing protein n=1 Tax=Aplanochytrium stocchinoi TaxID=215587 RepID=A0A7S3PLI9_9STRA|mmetsp:Transcript_31792/g.39222  ORF Transcript_31792/g.39222 Transcript_31792/m.39222 type:complete len:328 (-) Transcript_31792:452-1435(-)|eukprot:CAMPEP_0204840646 /NCGR_PEP_ID=MMETSP1346-20131115/38333_1 /ASSEMBLY_ACC=CAM_ASM_000771 /TAXON_ID=215587 /ORGANISM="Aplanochytrium stocchinoi, Strain GSBS06" /LENGTH=327 /DNA_ID=CAMNT_0051978169 /DNA_START=249 /DNA_END=1232 /DNA_ORIENTATION=+
MSKSDYLHDDRPGVYFVSPKTGEISPRKALFGDDLFVKAGIIKKTGKDLKAFIKQDVHGNCIVSAEGEESEGLPAGAYTINHNAVGLLYRVVALKIVPYMRKKHLNHVRLASVILPIIKFAESGKEYLLLTQRVHKKKGSYNDIWVFPGGHVERGERIAEAASREMQEETGLMINPDSLQPLCCWQEFMVTKTFQVQFLICLYVGSYEVEEGIDEVSFLKGLNPQEEEVNSAVLMPKGTWELLSQKKTKNQETSHYSHGEDDILWETDDEIDSVQGISYTKEKGYELTSFKVDDLFGQNKNVDFVHGIHGPHKFGLRMLLKKLQRTP